MDTELQAALTRLSYLIDTVPGIVRNMDDGTLQEVPGTAWSRLQILGHLIDSATNNWQRFIRIQYEDNPQIAYDADKWNLHNYYNRLDKELIVNLWENINRQLLHIAQNIPADKLERTGTTDGVTRQTLRYLIIDYIAHMEHHLVQITGYKL